MIPWAPWPDTNAGDCWVYDNHFAYVADVARLITVDEGTVLLPEILVLYALLLEVFSSIIEYELVLVPVHGSELADAQVTLFLACSLLVLLQRDQIIRLLLERYLLAVQDQHGATAALLKIQIEGRRELVHSRLVPRDRELELAYCWWYWLHYGIFTIVAE